MQEKEIPSKEDLAERRRFVLVMVAIFTLMPALAVSLLLIIGRTSP